MELSGRCSLAKQPKSICKRIYKVEQYFVQHYNNYFQNLVTKSTEINDGLQNLTNSLDQTSLRLNIAQNEFQSLRNSQFIESRVYEDDETLPHREVDDKAKVKSFYKFNHLVLIQVLQKEEVDVDRTEDLKCAALKGLEVLEKYYDKVEVSISDSEDEDIDLPT